MLNRISAALQSAVDTIAPPVAPLHDFVYHWRQVMRFYDGTSEALSVPIESTHLPIHLDRMLTVLQDEQEEQRRSANGTETGPCLEYLLQHRIPDLLASLSCADTPSGMKHLGLVTFARLVTMTSDHLLVQAALYEPVQRMVRLCGQVAASPTESQEVRLLCVLVAVLGQRPQLAPLFRLPRKSSPCTSSLQDKDSSASETRKDNLLADALLRYIDSADGRLRVKACESLLVLAAQPSTGPTLAEESCLAETLALRLAALFRAIPDTVDPADMEDVQASWGMECPLELREEFPGCRQFAAFLAWLDFCDKVAGEGQGAVGSTLVKAIHLHLLTPELAPRICAAADLLGISEDQDLQLVHSYPEQVLGCCVTLGMVCRMLRQCHSPQMREGIARWLAGGAEEDGPGSIKGALVNLLALSHGDLALETMRLIEVLIDQPNPWALHLLLLQYLDGSRTSRAESPTDAPESRYPTSVTFAPTNIHLVLEGFLQLLPPLLRSGESEAGYESYLQDAQRQYEGAWQRCRTLDYPLEGSVRDKDEEDRASSDSRPEADLPLDNKESLLSLLLDRLENFPNQEYEVNLQLTALLSRLALLPHAPLHETLLSPSTAVNSPGPPLTAALRRLASKLAKQAPEVCDLEKRLKSTRQRLLGDATSPCDPQDQQRDAEESLLASVVVLEEFCKELAAIAFVKYHLHSPPGP